MTTTLLQDKLTQARQLCVLIIELKTLKEQELLQMLKLRKLRIVTVSECTDNENRITSVVKLVVRGDLLHFCNTMADILDCNNGSSNYFKDSLASCQEADLKSWINTFLQDISNILVYTFCFKYDTSYIFFGEDYQVEIKKNISSIFIKEFGLEYDMECVLLNDCQQAQLKGEAASLLKSTLE